MFKKIMIALAVVLAPSFIYAQSRPYFGVRASFDVTHPSGANDGINNGSGFTFTGIYNLPISRNAYFEPGVGVFYNTMGINPIEYENGYFDGSIRNAGIRVPLNVGYRVELFNGFELAGFTGPIFNFNLATNTHLNPNFQTWDPVEMPSMFDYGWHHFDAQWGFGVSATFQQQYYIAISGGIGMSSMATFKTPDSKDRLRRNSISISVGYNF